MNVSNRFGKVLMIDAFSTLHVGNGALIDNTYKLCKEHIGDQVEIISIDAETNKGRFPVVLDDIFTGYGGSTLKKLTHALAITIFITAEYINTVLFNGRIHLPWARRYRRMLEALDRSDICVSLSGETINDHYRPHMYLRLITYYLAVLKGKKFIIFPQSIGPIFRPLTRWLLRKTLGRAHAIIARDRESLALAKTLWADCRVEVLFSPDVATTQESSAKPLPVASARKKVIGLTVSDIPRNEMEYRDDYLQNLLDGLCSALAKDTYQILIMPSNYKHDGFSKDYLVCLDAKRILEERGFDVTILKNEIIHPDVYQGMQRSLFAFISTRMHVGILATSAGVPTLMINTQHKIRSYMSLVGMEDFVLELRSLEKVPEKVTALLEQNAALRVALGTNTNRLREQVNIAMSNLGKSLL